ncbi:HNH endonuclease [Shewanella baltica]|uniref:HNH endonuclease n=1 Tax=Shewanella baltica TaxID=62322 RepID=UPI003D7BCA25
MNYYWVNVGRTFKEVIQDGVLWAPTSYTNDKGIKINSAGWKPIPNIRKGDIVFCNRDGFLICIVVANADAISSPPPESRGFDKWKSNGFKVDVSVTEISPSIDTKIFRKQFFEEFNNTCTPKLLNKFEQFSEVYAVCLSRDAGEFLLKYTGEPKTKASDVSRGPMDPSVREAYSWRVLNELIAIKSVDKSVIKEFSTGVPSSIVSFFCPTKLVEGESVAIELMVTDQLYQAKLKRKSDNRHVLQLRDIRTALHLEQLTIDTDTIWFEKVQDNVHRFLVYSKSVNPELSVLPQTQYNSGKGSMPTNTSGVRETKIRYGQDYFKSKVAEICDNKCVVLNVPDQKPSILIGSHIKSWADSNNDERMDGHNGLLLSPHVDKLFDTHLITFDEQGYILVSAKLNHGVLTAWGIDTEKKYYFTEMQKKYLEYHREQFNLISSDVVVN